MENLIDTNFIGGIFAIISAFLWALGTVLLKKIERNFSPVLFNIIKSIIVLFCFGILLLIVRPRPITFESVLFLAIAGILTNTFGDTIYISALKRLSPKIVVILSNLIPVFTVFLALVILRERPSHIAWLGIILTIFGITWVMWVKSFEQRKESSDFISGIKLGCLSIFFYSSSIIISKIALFTVSSLQAGFFRNLFGFLGLCCWGAKTIQSEDWRGTLTDYKLMKQFFIVSFFSAVLGTWFCLLGLKFADASIATVLNSTSPLFVLPLSSFFLKESISFHSIFGAIISVIGVCLILLN